MQLLKVEQERHGQSDASAYLVRLVPFLGEWRGTGKGSFPTPTVDDFSYEECTLIERNGNAPYFRFQQTTWILDSEGKRVKDGHYESGVLRPHDDGSIILSTAQDSTRTEILIGQFDEARSKGGSLVITFKSSTIEGDERMLSSERAFVVNEDEFSYTMGMATTKVQEMTHHLSAQLTRVID